MPDIFIRGLSRAKPQGKLQLGFSSLPCALGRSGRRSKSREGDGITPVGRWTMRHVFFRPDRIVRPRTLLPASALHPKLGWCDAPGDPNYNRVVELPYPGRHECLWRKDHLYDVVVVLGYNDLPRLQGRGSAIFMHLTRPDYPPTEGCIAVSLPHMLRIVAQVRPGDAVTVL